MNVFLRWAQTARSTGQRAGFLVLGGVVFLGLFPSLLVFAVPRLDVLIRTDGLLDGPAALVLGCLSIVGGGALALWSIAVQVGEGSGTPLPMAPTQRLLTSGPFAWCRNPMALGTILAYLGVSLAVGSLAAVMVVAALAGLLLLFIARVEERELLLRFGEAYRRYRAVTPFLVPRRPARGPRTTSP